MFRLKGLVAPEGLRNDHARVAAAWHSRRGMRPSQEDRVTVIPDLSALPGLPRAGRYRGFSYVAIFDGHRGHGVATHAAATLHEELRSAAC